MEIRATTPAEVITERSSRDGPGRDREQPRRRRGATPEPGRPAAPSSGYVAVDDAEPDTGSGLSVLL